MDSKQHLYREYVTLVHQMTFQRIQMSLLAADALNWQQLKNSINWQRKQSYTSPYN